MGESKISVFSSQGYEIIKSRDANIQQYILYNLTTTELKTGYF